MPTSNNSCDLFIYSGLDNDISYCYDATSYYYVSLSQFRDIYQFSSSDISTNRYGLDISCLDISTSDITYYFDSSINPQINIAHSMIFGVNSENPILDISGAKGLLKHDFIRYIAKSLFGTTAGLGLLQNKKNIYNNIEIIGWNNMINLHSNLFLLADNSGVGLSNNPDNYNINITRKIMKQIALSNPDRYDICGNNGIGIVNTTGKQSVPFYDGDTINYVITINPAQGQEQTTGLQSPIESRKYRIKLILKNDINNYSNEMPTDSLADEVNNIYGITSYGVPT